MIVLVYVDVDQGIHKGKVKLLEMLNEKKVHMKYSKSRAQTSYFWRVWAEPKPFFPA